MFSNKKLFVSLLMATSILLSSLSYAQEELPRDNGIISDHRAPRWRESEEHPLRILAYVLHPIGWVAREAIFRPLSAFAASTETTRSVMGFREPFDYRESSCFSTSHDYPSCKETAPLKEIIKSEGMGNSDGEGEASRQVFFPDVNFDFNKSSLNNLGVARVKQMAALLQSVPEMNVVVEGHTDFKGSDQYNVKLGEKRAAAVIKELASQGVEAGRLSPISYGESKPLYTEETDWARAANRRVQFNVKGQGEVNSATPTELPPAAE